MKIFFLITATLFFIGCSGGQNTNAPDPNKEKLIAKNKQTAIANEVTLITQAAQKIENEGRGMEVYRNSAKPESLRECNIIMADEQKQIQNLIDRIAKLPEDKNGVLMPIAGDLNECVACTKTAQKSCVKARASINEAIKKLF